MFKEKIVLKKQSEEIRCKIADTLNFFKMWKVKPKKEAKIEIVREIFKISGKPTNPIILP